MSIPFLLGLGIAGGVAYAATRKPSALATPAPGSPSAPPVVPATPGGGASGNTAALAAVNAAEASLAAIEAENTAANSQLDPTTGYTEPQSTDATPASEQPSGPPPGTVPNIPLPTSGGTTTATGVHIAAGLAGPAPTLPQMTKGTDHGLNKAAISQIYSEHGAQFGVLI